MRKAGKPSTAIQNSFSKSTFYSFSLLFLSI